MKKTYGFRATPKLKDAGASDAIVVEDGPHPWRAEAMKRALENGAGHAPSLSELARIAGISRFHVVRLFKRHYGFTPHEYAQFLRLERFFWSLVERGLDRTLLALSGEAGYGDYSTFHHRMRETFRRAPSQLLDDDARSTLGPG